jgi:hypothetical protein
MEYFILLMMMIGRAGVEIDGKARVLSMRLSRGSVDDNDGNGAGELPLNIRLAGALSMEPS